MQKSCLVECVPNISEGRDSEKIRTVVKACSQVRGVKLLHVDSSEDANRTVVTFVGKRDAVLSGAFRLYQKAHEVIDMRLHSGAHPRIGAVDVCPFVPLDGAGIELTVQLARQLGDRVASELGVPVFFYDRAAVSKKHVNMANIRRGEFEGLTGRFSDGALVPDVGPCKVHETFGATVIGARDILIAFNIDLDTTNTHIAKKIAAEVRESGLRVKNELGESVRVAGLCKSVKAIGWFMKTYGQCQVSTNLTNYRVSGLHDVMEAVRKISGKYGVAPTGSEIIGLVPEAALLDAGKYYEQQRGANSNDLSKTALIDLAVDTLGLSNRTEFSPDKKCLDYLCAL